jgi:hypothetical protein
MLVIREAQMKALRVEARRLFAAALGRHAAEHFPAAVSAMSAEELEGHCRDAIERSAPYGITGEREICLWLNLMLTFGRAFDADAALPWTAMLRQEPLPGPQLLVSRLYRAAQAQLAAANGAAS